jgi:NADPH-dependent 2,4-dienoyl-CoA reductase/sulfur reductase-like enzyme
VDGCEQESGETWDRLVLLLIAQPRPGWELEFEEITRREIKRLEPSAGAERGDE